MSELIKHECGIAVVRLLKPLEHYLAKYGTSFYGLQKLHLLMQKQHNRGQDGAGIASVKLGMEPGNQYIDRLRSNSSTPIFDIFQQALSKIENLQQRFPERLNDFYWLKHHLPFTGELFMGHLRYGTFGKNTVESLHPFVRSNNWKTRNLVIAGNFNMTNVDELFDRLVSYGQYPVETSDTVTVLEKIGHFLDEENERLYAQFRAEGYTKQEISQKIAEYLDINRILKEAAERWDGGYVITGMLGHGDLFVMRDPAGIRPAFYYQDDEVVVAASERPVIQTTFNVGVNDVHELKPGHVLVVKQSGFVSLETFTKPTEKKACSFERIYFSRGTDKDIYNERKALGRLITPKILERINYNLEDTVFSYIPNTAVGAFKGMVESLNEYSKFQYKNKILELGNQIDEESLDRIFSIKPRVEYIAVKDIKLRTFITQDNQRDDLVAHVYDVTYGLVRTGRDTLVVVDDSIVRGTTLKRSIIRILDRLGPKKIIIVSSAPQIRYPDCYGIDMAKLSDFIAFRATIELLKETRQEHIINSVYQKCKAQEGLPKEQIVNHVKEIYAPFTDDQISVKIADMVKNSRVKAEVEIIYQGVDELHQAIPGHTGDWYFTGNYPTPGGNKVVNKSFINYIEGKDERAY